MLYLYLPLLQIWFIIGVTVGRVCFEVRVSHEGCFLRGTLRVMVWFNWLVLGLGFALGQAY